MENNGILKSFDLQNELNSKIWIKVKGDNYVISEKVREKLLEIAYEFIESLKVDIIVSDVHLTGSLSNYNWSEYSDFDLHVIADFNQFPKNKLDLYKELLTLKKTIFNSDQNIKIYGYDVELYVQDENEEHTSTGVYSLISNDWIEKPKKEKFEVNKSVLKKKIDQWTEKIDKVLESAEEEKDLQKSKKIIDNLKAKIKDYRKIGLEKSGEMSYENLVFKYLRRSGHIEKLFNFKKEKLDKGLSLKESLLTEMEMSDISSLSTYRIRKIPSREYFMVHHTAGLGTAKGVVGVLNSKGLSVQWVVDVDGKIYRTLPAGSYGAHVGNNSRNRKVSNSNTEGVEVIGLDDDDIKKRHEADIAKGILPRQAESVRQIVKSLGYTPNQLVGHGEVSNNRGRSEGQTIIKYIRDNWDEPLDFDPQSISTTTTGEDESGGPIKNFFNRLFKKGNKKGVKTDDPKKADLVAPNKEEIIKNLNAIDEPVKQVKKGAMDFQKNVESIQMALVTLGYELPRFGVDGLYGPETAESIRKFKIDNNIKESYRPLNKLFESYLDEDDVLDAEEEEEIKLDKGTITGDVITPSTIQLIVDKLKNLSLSPSKLEKLSDVDE
jgi:N-acetyl-anhydromuramyl-L-alanine amidase AmpD